MITFETCLTQLEITQVSEVDVGYNLSQPTSDMDFILCSMVHFPKWVNTESTSFDAPFHAPPGR